VVTLAVNRDHVEVAQVSDRLGVRRHGGNVAGQEMFVRADAKNKRTTASRADHQTGLVLVNGNKAVGAGDFAECLHDGRFQAVLCLGIERVEMKSDQEGQHLRVRFRPELIAFFHQLLL